MISNANAVMRELFLYISLSSCIMLRRLVCRGTERKFAHSGSGENASVEQSARTGTRCLRAMVSLPTKTFATDTTE
jgi:hypothetical protein